MQSRLDPDLGRIIPHAIDQRSPTSSESFSHSDPPRRKGQEPVCSQNKVWKFDISSRDPDRCNLRVGGQIPAAATKYNRRWLGIKKKREENINKNLNIIKMDLRIYVPVSSLLMTNLIWSIQPLALHPAPCTCEHALPNRTLVLRLSIDPPIRGSEERQMQVNN